MSLGTLFENSADQTFEGPIKLGECNCSTEQNLSDATFFWIEICMWYVDERGHNADDI